LEVAISEEKLHLFPNVFEISKLEHGRIDCSDEKHEFEA
jgi:hypothetical protein